MVRKHALIIVSIFFSRFVIFAITPFYFRGLDTESIADIEIYTLIASFASIFIGFELNQAISRFFPALTDEAFERKQLASILSVNILASIVVIPIIFFAVTLLKESEFRYVEFFGLVCISLSIVISSIMQGYFRSRFYDRKLVVFNVLYAAVILFSTALLYLIGSLSVFTYLVIPFVACSISFAFTINLSLSDISSAISPNFRDIKPYILFSYPLVIVATINALFYFSDRAVIINLLDDEALAIYGLGLRFSLATSFLYMTIGIILTPRIMKLGMCLETQKYILRALRLCLVFMIFIILFLVLMGDELVLMLSKEQYLPISSVLVSFVTLAALTNSYVFMPGIDFRYKTHLHIFPTVLGIFFFFLLIDSISVENIGNVLIVKVSAGYIYFVAQYLLNWRFMKPPILLLAANTLLYLVSIIEIVSFLGSQ